MKNISPVVAMGDEGHLVFRWDFLVYSDWQRGRRIGSGGDRYNDRARVTLAKRCRWEGIDEGRKGRTHEISDDDDKGL